MKAVFYRHSLLNRGGDKMILAHAGRMAQQGWTVEIWTAHVDTLFPLPAAVKIVDLGTRNKFGTLWQAVTKRFDADLVIADIIPLICLLAVRNRSKLIYFAQDYDETYYSSVAQRFFIRLLYGLGLGLLRVRSIAVADHLTHLLRRRFLADVVTVTNGVDTEIFFPEPDQTLCDGKEGRKAILLLSRSDARKGFDLGCRIANDVKKRMGNDSLEIWTVGEPTDAIFEGVACRDLGYVSAERLRQILSSADVFIYHTRHEGFPLMALEAMACGCPMAASSAVPEVLPGRDALIAPVGDITTAADHVVDILQNDQTADRLRGSGLVFAAKHSLQESSRNFVDELMAPAQ